MFFDHPSSVCMSYIEHLKFSLNLATLFSEGAMKAIIHSFLPNYYITSSSDISKKIQLLISESGCIDKDNESIKIKKEQ